MAKRRLLRRPTGLRCFSRMLWRRPCPHTSQAYDQHFDYTSFETGFQQPHLDVLNYPSINGNFMMTSTDNHRPEMVANGNALAEFYNNFNADYNHPTAERRRRPKKLPLSIPMSPTTPRITVPGRTG